MSSKRLFNDFEPQPIEEDLPFKINLRQISNKYFEYKISDQGFSIINGFQIFNKFTPTLDTWTSFQFNNSDIYLYLEITVSSQETNNVVEYKILDGNFKLTDKIENIQNFGVDTVVKSYSNNLNYYCTKSSRYLMAIFPYLNATNIIYIYTPNLHFMNSPLYSSNIFETLLKMPL